MIFDTHAHYDDEAFDQDREQLLAELLADRIAGIANIGFNKKSIESSLALAEKQAGIWSVLGFHPDNVGEMEADKDRILPWLREQLLKDKVIGLGEIGLDYHWNVEPCEIQKKWFRAQLDLARELDLPLVVHSRDAAQDTMDILQEEKYPEGRLVMHCYSYSLEQARIYLNMGYYLGIGGVVTFKNAKKLKEVVSFMPPDRILLETDCPYMAPVPFRGKRNDSGKIPLIIDTIAELKGISSRKLEDICLANALSFYRLRPEDLNK